MPLQLLLEHAQSDRLSGKSCRLSLKPQWLCDSLSQYGGSLARWRLNCSFFVWIPLPWLTRQHAASLQPLPHYIFFPPCPSQSNWSSTAISLCLFIYCFLTRLLFVLIFFLPFLPTSPLFFPPLSAVEWWCAVVSPLRGIISVVWERSNLTCPVRLKEGCVRSDLSHTARILPGHETSGLPSPSRHPPPFMIINQMKDFSSWFSSL